MTATPPADPPGDPFRTPAPGAPVPAAGRPLLTLEHVSKRFGGLRAVNNVSLTITEGEVLFIVGPNGAGKTTLFNLITGFLPPDEGVIRFAGRLLAGAPPHQAARLGISRTFQIVKPLFNLITGSLSPVIRFASRSLAGTPPHQAARLGIGRTFQIVKPLRNLTVLENVMLGAFLHTRDVAGAAARAREVLEFLEMGAVSGLPAAGLPLATLKRLEIARALATRPKLILLDEVVAGLPTAEALALAGLLQRLPEWGVSAVAGVEHVMQVVMKVAHRVVVLDRGALIAEGTPADVVRRPEVIEAYLGAKYKQVTG